MKRIISCGILGIILCLVLSACHASSRFQVYKLTAPEGIDIDIPFYSSDDSVFEPEEDIEFTLQGKTYYAKYLLTEESRYPFRNPLYMYKVLDTDNIYEHDTIAWASKDPKSGKIVIYTSFYETNREKKAPLSEVELQEIADQIAGQYISLEDYVCKCSTNEEPDGSLDSIFYYNRYFGDVQMAGGIIITLTCDGGLRTLHNHLTEEWEYALSVMGEEYYIEKAALLTSEEAQKEIEKWFSHPDIKEWTIGGKALYLIDETHVGVYYSVSYSYYTGKDQMFTRNTIGILLTEKAD